MVADALMLVRTPQALWHAAYMTVCPKAKKMEAKALPDDPCADPSFKEAAVDAARLRKDEVAIDAAFCKLKANRVLGCWSCSGIVVKRIVAHGMRPSTASLLSGIASRVAQGQGCLEILVG